MNRLFKMMPLALPIALMCAIAMPVSAETTETPSVYETKSAIPQLVYQEQSVIAGSSSNPFNRLLKKASRPHLPPSEDEIHDHSNEGTMILQHPLQAYEGLPETESKLGNSVHWVKAVDDGHIKPRWDRFDPTAEPSVMDMDILRIPKSSMPNVLFPHRQHTEWLACSNCHPAIFIPRKGANQINMSAIILGEKCGVCHGKVAFPVSECRRCHSQPKEIAINTKVSPPTKR